MGFHSVNETTLFHSYVPYKSSHSTYQMTNTRYKFDHEHERCGFVQKLSLKGLRRSSNTFLYGPLFYDLIIRNSFMTFGCNWKFTHTQQVMSRFEHYILYPLTIPLFIYKLQTYFNDLGLYIFPISMFDLREYRYLNVYY